VAHGQALNADGEVREATRAFLKNCHRCGHPDFEVTPEDDPDVAALWNPEEANWPDSCRREIIIGRNYTSLPGLDQAGTDKIYHAMANNWTAAMQDVEMTPRLTIGAPDGCRMYHRKEAMSGSVLAYHYLARNTCNDRLDGAFNTNFQWDLPLGSAVNTHECGHGLGLNHVQDSSATMYYAITPTSKGRYGYPNATDIAAMKALGYTPRTDWETRRPTLEKLFLPRGQQPEPPPPQPDDLETRVAALEMQQRIDAMQFEVLRAMIREMRG